MKIPPFALEVALPTSPEQTEFQLLLKAAPARPLPIEEDYASCQEVIGLFCSAVNAQMLSVLPPFPGISSLRVIESRWDQNLVGWAFRLAARAVPPESFLVLFALLAQTHYALEPLESVSLLPSLPAAAPVAVDTPVLLNRENNKLFRPQEIPFKLEEHGRQARRNIVITLEFKQPLSPKFRESLEHTLNVWAHLVELGGFEFTFQQQTFEPVFGSLNALGPRSVKLDIPQFETEPCSFDALLCLGVHLHAAGHEIDCLSID